MDSTLTLRLNRDQHARLTARARATGKTRSALVRELIEQGLEDRPIGQGIAHLKGRVGRSRPRDEWARRLKERNWR